MLLGPVSGENRGWKVLVLFSYTRWTMSLTLEELLACILVEECFVDNWSSEVVNHELEDGLDL